MDTYDVVQDGFVLSFIIDNDQQEFIFSTGMVETDGHTVWYTNASGKRYESITSANVVDVGVQLGLLQRR